MNGGTQEQYPGSAGQLSLPETGACGIQRNRFSLAVAYLSSAGSIALGLRQGRNVVVGECDEGVCLLRGM